MIKEKYKAEQENSKILYCNPKQFLWKRLDKLWKENEVSV